MAQPKNCVLRFCRLCRKLIDCMKFLTGGLGRHAADGICNKHAACFMIASGGGNMDVIESTLKALTSMPEMWFSSFV